MSDFGWYLNSVWASGCYCELLCALRRRQGLGIEGSVRSIHSTGDLLSGLRKIEVLVTPLSEVHYHQFFILLLLLFGLHDQIFRSPFRDRVAVVHKRRSVDRLTPSPKLNASDSLTIRWADIMEPASKTNEAGLASSVSEVIIPVEEGKYLSSKNATCPCDCGLADVALAEGAVVTG